jgi:hypothetical protein
VSHFTKVKTQMVEKQYLLDALKDLRYQYEDGDVEISGWRGAKQRAEVKVRTSHAGYDIGFRKNGNCYEMIADWWGIQGISKDSLAEQLNQRYAYHATRAKLESQGFTLVNEESEKDGQIRLVLRRMK